jgi:Domain of unknown function (DUF4335)
MTSNYLTTRTYTAPTCTLTVATPSKLAADRRDAANFNLELEHPGSGDLERIQIEGNERQLDRLQQTVATYISELVAKFPVPTGDHPQPEIPPSPATDPKLNSVIDRLYPERQRQSPRAGLMHNLPGLRHRTAEAEAIPAPQPEPEQNSSPQSNPFSAKSISQLLGRWQPEDRQNAFDVNAPKPTQPHNFNPASDGAPALTGGNRSLDHYLHLGDLATTRSGATLTLSAIQLFDLSTVLDEYVADRVEIGNQSPSQGIEKNSPSSGSRFPAINPGNRQEVNLDPATTALSRLPNLPKVPATPDPDRIYQQGRRSRSTFMSAMPWAAAAAVAVGTPLLLFSPQSNPLKESLSKVKMPDFSLSGDEEDSKKPIALQPPGVAPTSGTNGNNLPKPWQAQPVEPPKTNPLPNNGTIPQPQNSSTIGIAPLPPTLVSGSTPDPLNSINGGKVGIAPNPLNSNPLPSSGIDNIVTDRVPVTTPKIDRVPTTATAPGQNRPTGNSASVPPAKQPSKPGIKSPNLGKVSISTQPLPIPQNLPIDNNINSIVNQPAFPLPGKTDAGQIKPAPIAPPAQKKPAKQKDKPTTITTKPKSKPSVSTTPRLTPPVKIDPSSRPTNPNLITNPESGNPNPANDAQTPPIVPTEPIQSNASISTDPAENPSLQEAKRYFQSKWKADPAQSNALQYVLEVSGKSGLVQSVDPQGEAATNYLNQTKLIEKGQKLVSPVAGSSDQKIRVLLQPDGKVDTFVEP